jgi:hypothetical protein
MFRILYEDIFIYSMNTVIMTGPLQAHVLKAWSPASGDNWEALETSGMGAAWG